MTAAIDTAPVVSIVQGNNADLVAEAARLYIPDGSQVADVTWGKGAFWRKVDTSKFTVQGSDIAEHIGGKDGIVQADFRCLPYDDESFDVVVLDPPYVHNPGKHMTDSRYNNAETTTGLSHSDIRTLYRDGMREAMRVLRHGGRILVKGKDEIESGKQCWSQTELLLDAISLGLYGKDSFVLVPSSRTAMGRWSKQLHARKVHSFLWVFEKPTKTDRRVLHVVDEDGWVEQWTARRPRDKRLGGWVWV